MEFSSIFRNHNMMQNIVDATPLKNMFSPYNNTSDKFSTLIKVYAKPCYDIYS